mgnify:CR=1 FL=1
MSTMDLRLTPETIGDKKYSIPLYQRLFEWDAERITQLLNDLKEQQPTGKAYYIGMLTSTTEADLVDGQQRFTVMMLMGIALSKYFTPWRHFILSQTEPRLTFSARPEDQQYLVSLISSEEQDETAPYENKKMKRGLECIHAYLHTQFQSDEARSTFAEYVYRYMTFFITFLPSSYRQSSLNKYFERMNSTGKNLEGHEIVKVKMLHRLAGEKELYTKAWNRVADMDTHLFKVRSWEHEDENGMKQRIVKALMMRNNPQILFRDKLLNGLKDSEEAIGSGRSIKDVTESSKAPSKNQRAGDGTHSVMTFSDFLLQCLYYFLKSKDLEIGDITVFFNKANLVNTFEKRLIDQVDSVGIEEFFKCLVCKRILLDVYFVRILDGQGDYDYDLETPFLDRSEAASTLKMFESMLYVNSSPVTYYQWFNALIDIVDRDVPVETEDIYQQLKSWDDLMHPKEKLKYEDLNYKDVDRYWFWRLDFQIWLKRKELFVVGNDATARSNSIRRAIDVADKYVFKRNRSIEHIAPQTPLIEDTLKLEDDDRNSFGNLVMISSEQNSALSNSIYQEKKARVESFLEGSRSGSIESLKMLHAFTFNTAWSLEAIKEHGETMFDLLLNSYN